MSCVDSLYRAHACKLKAEGIVSKRAVRAEGTTSFSLMQAATEGEGDRLVYFAFDILHLDGEDLLLRPFLERKERLADVLKGAPAGLIYSDHLVGRGGEFFAYLDGELCAAGSAFSHSASPGYLLVQSRPDRAVMSCTRPRSIRACMR